MKYWVGTRYRYLESVSVFGIFVGIFFMSVRYSVSVSVFLKYWLKIVNFLVPHLYLAPLLRVTPSEFHSLFAKLEWWATRRWKSLIVKLAVMIHQRDKQTDTAWQKRLRYGLRREVNIYAFSHNVVWIVCFCYTLLINDCLVWSIVVKTNKKDGYRQRNVRQFLQSA